MSSDWSRLLRVNANKTSNLPGFIIIKPYTGISEKSVVSIWRKETNDGNEIHPLYARGFIIQLLVYIYKCRKKIKEINKERERVHYVSILRERKVLERLVR